ncbi:hypothetical protein AX16_009255 [Volvariella volvacea WC 439]|nr:hypothetical protein AX16_009255 [Volvariella volvacea WC 439]
MTDTITPEFLDHLESLYPATPSSTPHTWAFVAATAFSASNLPDAVPLVFEHAAKKLAPGGPRDQLRRKIKEAIFKSGLTSGYPKAINALIKFHAAIPEDANDTELLRDLSVDIKGFNQMGQEFFEQTYGETATSVQGLLRNAYPDLERFSTIIGYGYVYGNHDVLGPVETSFMLIAALIASDVPLQITWHLNGAVRFQNPAIAHKYSSTLHAIATIVREERFIGLFKGITSPLAAVALMNGLVFSSYRFFMKLQLENNNSTPTLTQIALAGAGSGIVSSIITTPTELIKIRQQSLLVPTTATRVVWQIYQTAGITGLYRGLAVTALRDCGYGAYFWAYEATCRLLSTPIGSLIASQNTSLSDTQAGSPKTLSWTALMLAGGVAGVAGWVATFPLDVVKTRVQGSDRFSGTLTPTQSSMASLTTSRPPSTPATPAPGSSAPHPYAERSPLLASRAMATATPSNPYRSMTSTIVHSYRQEGIRVFFRGLAPTLIRAIPVNMVTFATFEAVVHTLS